MVYFIDPEQFKNKLKITFNSEINHEKPLCSVLLTLSLLSVYAERVDNHAGKSAYTLGEALSRNNFFLKYQYGLIVPMQIVGFHTSTQPTVDMFSIYGDNH